MGDSCLIPISGADAAADSEADPSLAEDDDSEADDDSEPRRGTSPEADQIQPQSSSRKFPRALRCSGIVLLALAVGAFFFHRHVLGHGADAVLGFWDLHKPGFWCSPGGIFILVYPVL